LLADQQLQGPAGQEQGEGQQEHREIAPVAAQHGTQAADRQPEHGEAHGCQQGSQHVAQQQEH